MPHPQGMLPFVAQSFACLLKIDSPCVGAARGWTSRATVLIWFAAALSTAHSKHPDSAVLSGCCINKDTVEATCF